MQKVWSPPTSHCVRALLMGPVFGGCPVCHPRPPKHAPHAAPPHHPHHYTATTTPNADTKNIVTPDAHVHTCGAYINGCAAASCFVSINTLRFIRRPQVVGRPVPRRKRLRSGVPWGLWSCALLFLPACQLVKSCSSSIGPGLASWHSLRVRLTRVSIV